MNNNVFKIMKSLFVVALMVTSVNWDVPVNAKTSVETKNDIKPKLKEESNSTEESSVDNEVKQLSAQPFTIKMGDATKITKEKAIENAKVLIDGASVSQEEIAIDLEQLDAIKSATESGSFPLDFRYGEQRVGTSVTIEPDNPGQKKGDIEENRISSRVTQGSVSIDVPSYDREKGWQPESIYDVTVRVDFGDEVSTNKEVEITIPEGMRYVTIPVKGDYDATFIKAESIIEGFMLAVERPTINPKYQTYNGKVLYKFTNNTKSVEIKGIKMTPDGKIHYGIKNFPQGIVAKGSNSKGELGIATMAIGVYEASGYYHYSADNPKRVVKIGETDIVKTGNSYVRRGGYLSEYDFYIKQIDLVMSYPKGATVVGVEAVGEVELVSNNTEASTVHLRYKDVTTKKLVGLNLLVDKMPTGSHESEGGREYVLEMYDGQKITVSAANEKTRIDILGLDDPKINNVLDIRFTDFDFDSISSDYMRKPTVAKISNTALQVKEKQVVEFVMDANYEVNAVSFPAHRETPVESIDYKTNLGRVGTAKGDEIYPTRNTISGTMFGYGTDRMKLKFTEGEFFTYAKAKINDVAKNASSSQAQDGFGDTQSLYMLGRLKEGVNTANLTINTWADKDDDGNKDPNTENTKTAKVTRKTNLNSVYTSKTSNLLLPAGQTRKVKGTFGTFPYYYYSPNTAVIDPIIYLRIPRGLNVNPNTIVVTQNEIGVPREIEIYNTSKGEYVMAIKTKAKIGYYFDGPNVYGPLEFSYDITADINATGNLQFSDLIFFDSARKLTPGFGAMPVVEDKYDLNNNGDVTEKMGSMTAAALNIQEQKTLTIDTFIKPEGENRRPPYDEKNPETAIGFTPNANAVYTLDAYNNRDDKVTLLRVFAPVPKQGNDFGIDFQTEAFDWNMKVKNIPTIKVFDKSGVDVTAERKDNYRIEYSVNATNQSNYRTATYTGVASDQATMLRVENTAGMIPGESVRIEFSYAVDETSETINAEPNKLGSINVFKPFYDFSAGTSGSLSGTSVGALLQVGEISGLLFEDKVIDGEYKNGEDTVLAGRKITLNKKVGANFVKVEEVLTGADGKYSFSGQGNGNYQVDFNSALATNEKFTWNKKGEDDNLDSDVDFSGVNSGFFTGIDPTEASSRAVTAGIVAYDNTKLGITVSSEFENITMKASNANVNKTLNVATTISPSFFNDIQAIENGIVWTSNNFAAATARSGSGDTVISAGQTTKVNQVAVITAVITDMYGNKAKKNINVTIEPNNLPTSSYESKNIEAGSVVDDAYLLSLVTISDFEDQTIIPTVTHTIPLNSKGQAITSGSYRVNYQATDNDKNVVDFSYDIDVADTAAPTLSIGKKAVILPPSNDAVVTNWSTIFDVTATDLVDGDLTGRVVYTNDSTLDSMNKQGLYTIGLAVADTKGNITNSTAQVLITDKQVEFGQVVNANSFVLKLSEVNSAKYEDLAKVKGYDVSNSNLFAEVPVRIVDNIRPNKVGRYSITFATEKGANATVEMLVIADSFPNAETEAVYADNFVIKLSAVKGADYKALAKAKGYTILNATTITGNVEVEVENDIRPTTVGRYTLTFKTQKGTKGTAEMLVVTDDFSNEETEVVYASDFAIKLSAVKGADYKALAKAKGHTILNGTTITGNVEVEVENDIRPTAVGRYTLTFRTQKGTKG
ncbi:MAG: SdrD B-like domain-containing protein, partial [Culicoidibacterales bacterium]